MSNPTPSDTELFVCDDGWAHDIKDSPGGQSCHKCNKYLDNLVLAYTASRVMEARIDELTSLRDQTREVTHPDAHISDTGVAQSIRVHTNSLIEYRLATLIPKSPEGEE